MSYAVLTDSASNLTKELLEKYNIGMISFKYTHNGKEEECFDKTVSYEEAGSKFYDGIRNGEVYKTSLLSVGEYLDFFRPYLLNGEDILYISLSGALSGTYNCACNAKDMLKEEFPERTIEVIDPMSASFGEGLLVMRASELRSEGKSLEEVVKEILPIRLNIRNEFTVDDATYLNRGGRLSALVFKAGNLLNIKPLLKATLKGGIGLGGVARGRKRALAKMAESVKENILEPMKQTLFIAHCDVIDEAKELAGMIKEAVPALKNIFISMYDFCTGSHVGPGTIAIFYYGKARS